MPVYLPSEYGSVFERKKLGDAYRTAITTTVLTYIETAKDLKKDPLGMKTLPISGAIVLGGELPERRNSKGQKLSNGASDSVWWVVVSAAQNGAPTQFIKLADDLSKWRSSLNKQLKEWDEKSAVKKLSSSRAALGGVIAAVVVATVVITVVTFGTGSGAAAAGGAAAANAAAANMAAATAAATAGAAVPAGLTAAGGSAGLLAALEAVDKAASAGKSVADAAAAVKQILPNQNAEKLSLVGQQAAAESEMDQAAPSEPSSDIPWVLPVMLMLGGLSLLAFAFWPESE